MLLALLVSDEIDTVQKGWQHVIDLGPLYWGSQVFWLTGCLVCARSESERVQGVFAAVSFVLFLGAMYNGLAAV